MSSRPRGAYCRSRCPRSCRICDRAPRRESAWRGWASCWRRWSRVAVVAPATSSSMRALPRMDLVVFGIITIGLQSAYARHPVRAAREGPELRWGSSDDDSSTSRWRLRHGRHRDDDLTLWSRRRVVVCVVPSGSAVYVARAARRPSPPTRGSLRATGRAARLPTAACSRGHRPRTWRAGYRTHAAEGRGDKVKEWLEIMRPPTSPIPTRTRLGGIRQRVEIARALAASRHLLLDEPSRRSTTRPSRERRARLDPRRTAAHRRVRHPRYREAVRS